ncbi:hypothetical protein [Desulfofustis limnaeus]|nr:hypothetical protein [Desulfofustis limnaeus]
MIQLLVAAIAGLGVAQAGADLCPPDCSQCGVVAVASPCCAAMNGKEAVPADPDKTGDRPVCDHGGYCTASDANKDAFSVQRSVDVDVASRAPALVVVVPEWPVRQLCFSLMSLPQARHPALYTLHCSLIM